MTRPEPEALALDPGYGISELGELHWTLDDVFRRIDGARSWWVITVRPDGRPHAAPVWGVAVDDRIVFSSDPKAAKSANLATNPNIVVHLESGDEVVIVEGTVRRPRHQDLPNGYGERYNAKYSTEMDFSDPMFAFYEVIPRKIMAWDEGDFVNTAVRWRW